MKNSVAILLFLFCILSPVIMNAQSGNEDDSPTFDKIFKEENDRKNIQKLRTYLNSRIETQKNLKAKQTSFAKADSTLQSYVDKVKRLKNIIAQSTSLSLQVPQNLLNEVTNSKEIVPKTRTDIEDAIKEDSGYIVQFNAEVGKFNTLAKGIESAEQDINQCRATLDSLLAIELITQEHKQKVSLYFIILIGVMLIGFFLAFLSNRPMVMTLMGDYGLQFITIFVLIIAVVLFGVLGILQSSELAAILSGISGYILGKGRGGSSLQPKDGKKGPDNSDN